MKRWIGLAALAAIFGGASPLSTKAAPALAGQSILPVPPECETRTAMAPLTPLPSWAFVVNFDVIERRENGNEYPVGCLVVWRTPFNPTDFVRVDSCDVYDGNATFSGGRVALNGTGAHIRCIVNIRQLMASLTPAENIGDKVEYPPFEIIGVGRVEAPSPVSQSSNPVMYYQPDPDGENPVALYLATFSGGDVFGVASTYNGIFNAAAHGFPPSPDDQTWSAKHERLDDGTYRVVHSRDWAVQDEYAPRLPVDIWTNGGTFWIGGSPEGLSFKGSLDEVIADPADRAGPTAGMKANVFVPLMMR